MTDIKYIQLEPAAFLADIDFQMMDAEQRGVYWSIILFLYTNNGKLVLDNGGNRSLLLGQNHQISVLSNCMKTGTEWEKVWKAVAKKFKIKNGVLSHKRVSMEIKKARNYRQKKSLAGRKGMQRRYNSVSNGDITKVSKGKVSKGKGRKEKKRKETFTPPTLQEVQEYIRQNNYDVDAQKFISHYSKLGWKNVNGKPVKNWKQTLIQVWVKKDERSRSTQGQLGGSSSTGRKSATTRKNRDYDNQESDYGDSVNVDED